MAKSFPYRSLKSLMKLVFSYSQIWKLLSLIPDSAPESPLCCSKLMQPLKAAFSSVWRADCWKHLLMMLAHYTMSLSYPTSSSVLVWPCFCNIEKPLSPLEMTQILQLLLILYIFQNSPHSGYHILAVSNFSIAVLKYKS